MGTPNLLWIAVIGLILSSDVISGQRAQIPSRASSGRAFGINPRQSSSAVEQTSVSSSAQPVDFDCPEEFGYYPHPTDCTQYYVCVFGGALLESCTGGLMYSNELQTCDWPRNVGCDGAEIAPAPRQQQQQYQQQSRIQYSRTQPQVQQQQRQPEQQREQPRIRFTSVSSTLAPAPFSSRPTFQHIPPPPQLRVAPNPVITSRGQPKQINELYAEEQLPPAEEEESDRQQRVYRGQPSTIGQVQRDRDGIYALNNINSLPNHGKIGSFAFSNVQEPFSDLKLQDLDDTSSFKKHDRKKRDLSESLINDDLPQEQQQHDVMVDDKSSEDNIRKRDTESSSRSSVDDSANLSSKSSTPSLYDNEDAYASSYGTVQRSARQLRGIFQTATQPWQTEFDNPFSSSNVYYSSKGNSYHHRPSHSTSPYITYAEKSPQVYSSSGKSKKPNGVLPLLLNPYPIQKDIKHQHYIDDDDDSGLPDNFSYFHLGGKGGSSSSNSALSNAGKQAQLNYNYVPNTTPKSSFIAFSTVGGFYNNQPTTPNPNNKYLKQQYFTPSDGRFFANNPNKPPNSGKNPPVSTAKPYFDDDDRFYSYQNPPNYNSPVSQKPKPAPEKINPNYNDDYYTSDFFPKNVNSNTQSQGSYNNFPGTFVEEVEIKPKRPNYDATTSKPVPGFYITEKPKSVQVISKEKDRPKPVYETEEIDPFVRKPSVPNSFTNYNFEDFVAGIRNTNYKEVEPIYSIMNLTSEGALNKKPPTTIKPVHESYSDDEYYYDYEDVEPVRPQPKPQPVKPQPAKPQQSYNYNSNQNLNNNNNYFYDNSYNTQNSEPLNSNFKIPIKPPTTYLHPTTTKAKPKPITTSTIRTTTKLTTTTPYPVDSSEYYYDDEDYDYKIPANVSKFMPMSETMAPRPTIPTNKRPISPYNKYNSHNNNYKYNSEVSNGNGNYYNTYDIDTLDNVDEDVGVHEDEFDIDIRILNGTKTKNLISKPVPSIIKFPEDFFQGINHISPNTTTTKQKVKTTEFYTVGTTPPQTQPPYTTTYLDTSSKTTQTSSSSASTTKYPTTKYKPLPSTTSTTTVRFTTTTLSTTTPSTTTTRKYTVRPNRNRYVPSRGSQKWKPTKKNRNKTTDSLELDEKSPNRVETSSPAPAQNNYNAVPQRPKVVQPQRNNYYNTTSGAGQQQQYDPNQFDAYYSVYDEDVDLYRDVDYEQQYNQNSQRRPPAQSTYRPQVTTTTTPIPPREAYVPQKTYSKPAQNYDYDDALIGQIGQDQTYNEPTRNTNRGGDRFNDINVITDRPILITSTLRTSNTPKYTSSFATTPYTTTTTFSTTPTPIKVKSTYYAPPPTTPVTFTTNIPSTTTRSTDGTTRRENILTQAGPSPSQDPIIQYNPYSTSIPSYLTSESPSQPNITNLLPIPSQIPSLSSTQTTYPHENNFSYTSVDKDQPTVTNHFFIPIVKNFRDSSASDSNRIVEQKVALPSATPPVKTIEINNRPLEPYKISPIAQKPQSFKLPEKETKPDVIKITLTSSVNLAKNVSETIQDSSEVVPIFYRMRDEANRELVDQIIDPTTYSPIDFKMPVQKVPTPFVPPTTTNEDLTEYSIPTSSPKTIIDHKNVDLRKLQRGTFPPEYISSSTQPPYYVTTLKTTYEKNSNENSNRNSLTDSIQSFTTRNQVFRETLNKSLDYTYGKSSAYVSPYQSLRTLLQNEVSTTTSKSKPEEDKPTQLRSTSTIQSLIKNPVPYPTRSYFLITAPPEVLSSTSTRVTESSPSNEIYFIKTTKDNADLTTKRLKNYVFYSTPNSIDVEPTTYAPRLRFIPKVEPSTTTTQSTTTTTTSTTTTTTPITTTTTVAPSSRSTPSTTTETLTKRKIMRMRYQTKGKKTTTPEPPSIVDPEEDDNFEFSTQPLGVEKSKPTYTPFSYNQKPTHKRFHPKYVSSFSITNNTENMNVRSNFSRQRLNASNPVFKPRGRVVEITDKPVYFAKNKKLPDTVNKPHEVEDDSQWKPIVNPIIQMKEARNNREKFRATVEMPELNIPTESELASFTEVDDDENSIQVDSDDALTFSFNNETNQYDNRLTTTTKSTTVQTSSTPTTTTSTTQKLSQSINLAPAVKLPQLPQRPSRIGLSSSTPGPRRIVSSTTAPPSTTTSAITKPISSTTTTTSTTTSPTTTTTIKCSDNSANSKCNEIPLRPNRIRGGATHNNNNNNQYDSPSTASPNRGTHPPRVRPTLKPSQTIVSKAQEFVDIYRHPASRPEPIYPTPTPDKTAAKCRKDVCLLPDCFCGGKDIPGELPVEQIPQIVLLTFDDSVNDLNKQLYSDLFEKGRVNPNGCPISATFYVSHEWTDYSQVQNLYSDGHEMASHTVSHSFGEQFSQKKWNREVAGQREILSAYGGVKLEDVRGMRAPFLSIGGNKMFKMLYDSNFTYDSSMPVYENRPPSWPYTLDYKIFHDCMIPPCPTKSYPGVWEVPMVMWQDLNGGRCSMGDACANPPEADGVQKMLMKNFERHYTTNRAPFGLYYHAAWFTQPHHKEGFIQFLDAINSMKDVWLVTNWQALQWVRDPTPMNRLNSFQPFQCNYADRPKRCHHPKVCNLWHKSGVRYMKTCQPCPEIYPWTGKTGIRSSRIDNDIEE